MCVISDLQCGSSLNSSALEAVWNGISVLMFLNRTLESLQVKNDNYPYSYTALKLMLVLLTSL